MHCGRGTACCLVQAPQCGDCSAGLAGYSKQVLQDTASKSCTRQQAGLARDSKRLQTLLAVACCLLQDPQIAPVSQSCQTGRSCQTCRNGKAGRSCMTARLLRGPLHDCETVARPIAQLRDCCGSCRRLQGLAVRRRRGARARQGQGTSTAQESCRPLPSATFRRISAYRCSGTLLMCASATRTQTEGTRSQCHKGDRPSAGASASAGRLGTAEQRTRVGDRGRTWQCLEPGEVRVVPREPLQVVFGGCNAKGKRALSVPTKLYRGRLWESRTRRMLCTGRDAAGVHGTTGTGRTRRGKCRRATAQVEGSSQNQARPSQAEPS